MKKRTLSGFVRSKLNFINQQQEDGFLLTSIHELLEEEWGEKINYDSFLSMLHRARKRLNIKQDLNISSKNEEIIKENLIAKIEKKPSILTNNEKVEIINNSKTANNNQDISEAEFNLGWTKS